jgi:hypothetical protein
MSKNSTHISSLRLSHIPRPILAETDFTSGILTRKHNFLSMHVWGCRNRSLNGVNPSFQANHRTVFLTTIPTRINADQSNRLAVKVATTYNLVMLEPFIFIQFSRQISLCVTGQKDRYVEHLYTYFITKIESCLRIIYFTARL